MNVEEAIRAAAAAGPAYATDLAAIQRRGRRYAHRRTAAKAGAATAVLGVGSAFVIGYPHDSTPTVSATPSATASQSAAPSPSPSATADGPWTSDQRLVILGMSGWGVNNEVEIDAGITYSSLMRPDGKIVSHKFGASDRSFTESFVPLPDGRFVVLRTFNVGGSTKPDPAHPDGPSNPDIRTRLQILDAKEKVKVSHEVRHIGEYVQLLGATAESAYLARPKGVYRHDFATGKETLVLTTRVLGIDLSEADVRLRTSVEGDRLAVLRDGTGRNWEVTLYDLSTGTQTLAYPLSGVAAWWAGPLRISPDGRHVAVFYRTADDSRLAVVDLTTQSLAYDKTLVDPKDPYVKPYRTDEDERVRGVAWSDDRTLRIAWAQLPPGARGKYTFEELTRMRTLTIG